MDSEESEEKGGARRRRGKTQGPNIHSFVPGPPDLDEDQIQEVEL